MLRFGRRKAILGRGYFLLIGASIFGAGATDSTFIFGLGLSLLLIVLVDVFSSARRPQIGVELAMPPWAEVHVPSAVGLTVSQRQHQSILIHGAGPFQIEQHVFATGDARGETTLTINGRGLVDSIQLAVMVEGVVGIAGTRHAAHLPLATRLPVGPTALSEPQIDAFIDQLENEVAEPAVLGVRPYSVGDRRRDIHWRSTARTGELMVRERLRIDPDINRPIVVSALSENPARLEQALAQARHAAARCIALGLDTHLEVARPEGSRISLVTMKVGTEVDVMHLLATAVTSTMSPKPRRPGSAAILLGRGITCIPHG